MIQQHDRPLERRRFPRTQVRMQIRAIRLDPDGGDVTNLLETQDISRGGMGALTDRPLYPGQRMLLCLPLSDSDGRRNTYATVVRCRAVEDGYRVGLEFDMPIFQAAKGDEAVAAAA